MSNNPYFTVNINLGNDAMNSVEDVAGVLQALVDRLRLDSFDQCDIIKDRDGYTVGSYLFDWAE